MTRRRIIIGSLVAAVIIGSLTMGACTRHHMSDDANKKEWALKRATKVLDLRSDQQDALSALLDEVFIFKSGMEAEAGMLHDDLKDQLLSESIDRESLNALIAEQEQRFQNFRIEAVTRFTEFHDLLDAEQREEMVKHLERGHRFHRKH